NSTDKDMGTSDEILKKSDKKEQETRNLSSKVRNLIKEDKEAISKRNQELSKLDEDMDYLEDEKTEEKVEETVSHSTKAVKKKNKKRSGTIRNSIQKENRNSEENEKANRVSEKESVDEISDDSNEDVKLDFLANLNRDDEIENTSIRKRQPKRLRGSSQVGGSYGLKQLLLENKRNFYIGTAIAVLFMILIVALALDAGNGDKENNNGIHTEFLKLDAAPMIETINNYYAALSGDDVNQVKSFLMDSEKVTDDEIKRKSEETKVYADLISSSFLITDCYVQQGLKEKEYIAYMKFQLQIKSIETPAVGIFSCYIYDVSKDGQPDYKIGINVNDKSTDVYKYMAKMRNCSNVTKLFEDVNKELEEACSKDENLRVIVEALKNTEQSSTGDSEAVDDSTTVPMENVD
ncbi:MAG: hypothetical protein K2N34_02395, partial [Lachnospiraceae bacterium]|nr:hypothetical protein [Lachnospiraceae bacterium]